MLETTEKLPKGYRAIFDVMELKQLKNEKLKKGLYADENLEAIPQYIYLYKPNEAKYYPRWYWAAIPDEKIEPLVKKGLIYGNQ